MQSLGYRALALGLRLKVSGLRLGVQKGSGFTRRIYRAWPWSGWRRERGDWRVEAPSDLWFRVYGLWFRV